jgi:two-component system, NtrC family, sensor kinase
MRRRSRVDGKPAAKMRRVKAPKGVIRRSSAAAGLHKRVALLTRERDEALARQTATSDILRVISQSPTDVRPVFDSIVLTAARLLRCDLVFVLLCDGATFSTAAAATPEGPLADAGPMNLPIDRSANFPSRAILEKKMLYLPDWSLIDLPEHERKIHEVFGANSALFLPLLREEECIGLLTLVGKRAHAFRAADIAQAESFRDQALIAIENTRLFKESRESLEQQTATSEVLSVISSSPGELDPVFQTILANATRICQANFGVMNLDDSGESRVTAMYNVPEAFAALRRRDPKFRVGPNHPLGRVAATKQVLHIVDLRTEPGYLEGNSSYAAMVDLAGARTLLVVPMLQENALIGSISIYRQEVRPFTDKQIALVQNFAAQAVIAIENTRLLNELRQRTGDLTESLEQQTATSDVLRVISSSPGELEPVFQAMLENATRICEAKFGVLMHFDGEAFRFAAEVGTPPEFAEFMKRRGAFQPLPGSHLGLLLRTKQLSHTDDYAAEDVASPPVQYGGARSTVDVPMLKDNVLVGAISIYRQEVRPFTDKQIALLQNFAAQAVIAIENTRLLSELRQSLQQQTATADVLKIISRSTFDLQTVLDTLVESAALLCRAERASITLPKDRGYRRAASFGFTNEFKAYMDRNPLAIDRGNVVGRVVLEGKTVHVADIRSDPEHNYMSGALIGRVLTMSDIGNVRTILGVPMLRESVPVGVLVLTRGVVEPFTDKQIELATTFADQAVIAIENVRLFDDLQKRTAELTESLEQQTATSEVLSVISSSPGELEPVFQTILANATRICQANFGVMNLHESGECRVIAMHNTPEAYAALRRREPVFRVGPIHPLGRVAVTKQVLHIGDLRLEPGYLEGDSSYAAMVDLAGARSLLVVPMLQENVLIGSVSIYRQEVRPFTDKQIDLVRVFAAQAVIAIENTRLLNELRQRTTDLTESLEQQTATSEVLRVISSSPGDLQPTFETMLKNAVGICGAAFGNIYRWDGDAFHLVASHNTPPALAEARRRSPLRPTPETPIARMVATKTLTHVVDTEEQMGELSAAQADIEKRDPGLATAVNLGGVRTVLLVPMLRENELIGSFTVYRQEPRAFTEKQIALVTSFASQAVIAIENARLLTELRQRTDDLTASLDDLRTAQDRLVQTEKLASLGQLTAGIAHEIKNPLNFVNNFSAVSVELIDELRDALGGANLDVKLRAEIDEIADMLQGNLDKVVQHGKRADSIVKNMLLHSRQGSGEHRPVDVNALVEESLNLAYHGARAEKQDFNITLEKSFDPAAGEVDLFPQEITRVLLNLISNGFYAATKRKVEADGSYEPTLTAETRNLGHSVEIRVRDNGIGMPDEVKEKMFNPFFTTKPAGEGTGLGLSISHDIIVKQHGGSIEVDTQPGAYTEFRIVLPRGAATNAKPGERV